MARTIIERVPMSKLFGAILLMSTLVGTSAWCAGPTLTPDQIQAAIQEGSKFKTADQFFEKGLKGKRVQLASAMAVDGISKYATFFNDWQGIAAEAAAANQQMRELKVDGVHSSGLLHALVEVHARGIIPTGKMERRYSGERAHLVLKIGERVIQPTEKKMLSKSEQFASIFAGAPAGRITLDFAFDVLPDDLRSPVLVILIDGDGNKHQQKTDLAGILNISQP